MRWRGLAIISLWPEEAANCHKHREREKWKKKTTPINLF
jgi:hypothetical protein